MLTKLLVRMQVGFFLLALAIVLLGGHVLTAAIFGGMSLGFWFSAWGVWFLYE